MNSDAPLDYVEFQISPKRTRCELFISSGARTEKLASGLLKPFVENLKVAEEQVASAAQSLKLEVGRSNADSWFTKGTLERFLRYVSTPDVFDLVNTFDAEMSELEAARKIYSQDTGRQPSGGGGSGVATPSADDATKKELLKAIHLRIGALQQDLSNACARAVAAGFNLDSVLELQVFADTFRAHRLNEACNKFISLCERRPNLTNQGKSRPNDWAIRSSCESDMSIDDNDPPSPPPPRQKPVTFPIRRAFSRDSIAEADKQNNFVLINGPENETSTPDPTESIPASQPVRRLSVKDKINMFENKQKDHSGGKPSVAVAKPVELRRLSSDVSTTMGAAAVLRRWSGISDMSVDSSFEKKDTPESPLSNPSSSAALQEYNVLNFNDDNRLKEGSNELNSNLAPGESDGSKEQLLDKAQSRSIVKNQENSEEMLKKLLGVKNGSVVEFGDSGQLKILGGAQSQIHMPNRREDSKSKAAIATQPNLKSAEESGVRIREAFASRYKVARDNSPAGRKKVKSIWETEVVEKNEESQACSEKASSGPISGLEDSGPHRMKFSRQGSATKLDKKAKIQMTVAQDRIASFSTRPPDQFQKAREIKGNQELNDELKTNAKELEKVFDEHKKLRAPVDDQFNFISPQLSKNYQTNKSIESSKNKIKLNVPKKPDSQDLNGDDLSKSFSKLSVSEGSRGKLYDKYMKKRDAKLKDDWSSNRAEKEVRMNSMLDSLEKSRSEMNANFLGSSASRRAERLRSYNSMPIINRLQQCLDIEDGMDDELSFGDGISKMIVPNNRNLPVPRSTVKNFHETKNPTGKSTYPFRPQLFRPEKQKKQAFPCRQ